MPFVACRSTTSPLPSPFRSPSPATSQLASSGNPSTIPLPDNTCERPFILYCSQRPVALCRSSTSSLPSPSKSAMPATRQSRFDVRSAVPVPLVSTLLPFIRARCQLPPVESRVSTSLLPSPSKSPSPITSQSRSPFSAGVPEPEIVLVPFMR